MRRLDQSLPSISSAPVCKLRIRQPIQTAPHTHIHKLKLPISIVDVKIKWQRDISLKEGEKQHDCVLHETLSSLCWSSADLWAHQAFNPPLVHLPIPLLHSFYMKVQHQSARQTWPLMNPSKSQTQQADATQQKRLEFTSYRAFRLAPCQFFMLFHLAILPCTRQVIF